MDFKTKNIEWGAEKEKCTPPTYEVRIKLELLLVLSAEAADKIGR
jgi:hypothetical protein